MSDIKPLGGFEGKLNISPATNMGKGWHGDEAAQARVATLEQRLKESEAREADKACSISALEEQLKSCEFRRREQRDNFRKILSERKAIIQRLKESEAAFAQMREALRELKIRIAYIDMPQEPFWMDGDRKITDWRPQIKLLEAALSTDCGKAYWIGDTCCECGVVWSVFAENRIKDLEKEVGRLNYKLRKRNTKAAKS